MPKGWSGWIEVFKGGRQVDSKGRPHDGDALIDQAVSGFNADEPPPLVLGHPKDDSPAYGWTEAVRKTVRDGVAYLEAKVGDLAPEIVEMVKAGRYRNRSAAFYKDGRLRHIGLLGAVPPAVKGLAPLAFGEEAEAVFEFSASDADVFGRFRAIGRALQRVRDFLVAEKGLEEADRIINLWDVDYLKEAPPEPVGAGDNFNQGPPDPAADEEDEMKFSEEEVKAKIDAAVAEKEKDLAARDKELAKERAEFAEHRTAQSRRETEAFVDGLIRDGKALPAWKKAGLVEFMTGLDAGEEIQFSEGGEKQSQAAWFKKFLEGLGAHPLFKEMIPPEDDKADGGEFADISLDELTAHL